MSKKLNVDKNEEAVKRDIKKIIIPSYHEKDEIRASIICKGDNKNKLDQ